MQYRKKPVVIEAMRVAEVSRAMRDLDYRDRECAAWLASAIVTGMLRRPYGWSQGMSSKHQDAIEIETIEGVMRATDPNDWVIRGVNGELYPCADLVFQKTYEPVSE